MKNTQKPLRTSLIAETLGEGDRAFEVRNSFADEEENKNESSVKLCVFSEHLCEIAFRYPLSVVRYQDKIPRGSAFTTVSADEIGSHREEGQKRIAFRDPLSAGRCPLYRSLTVFWGSKSREAEMPSGGK